MLQVLESVVGVIGVHKLNCTKAEKTEKLERSWLQNIPNFKVLFFVLFFLWNICSQ